VWAALTVAMRAHSSPQAILDVRFVCADCSDDFELCQSCFLAGVEVRRVGHLSTHRYRVMDSLREVLLAPGWTLEQELLLLEGMDMGGFGNWKYVSARRCVVRVRGGECWCRCWRSPPSCASPYAAGHACTLPQVYRAARRQQERGGREGALLERVPAVADGAAPGATVRRSSSRSSSRGSCSLSRSVAVGGRNTQCSRRVR
jgi:hypothetical protein